MDDFGIEILALQLPCKIKLFGIRNKMHVINYHFIIPNPYCRNANKLLAYQIMLWLSLMQGFNLYSSLANSYTVPLNQMPPKYKALSASISNRSLHFSARP